MNLKYLSNDELLSGTKKIVTEEREILLKVLHHLKEIDARKLYLKIGYSSLWAYCTEELQYAESSAQRRIEAMRAIRDLPALESKIESGALSLSNIAKGQSTIRRFRVAEASLAKEKKPQGLSTNEKLEIFSQLENKSQKEAEKILAQEFPEVIEAKERIRRINAEETEVRYLAPNDLINKFKRIESLFSHKNPNPTQAELENMMADFVIAHKDPLERKNKVSKNTLSPLQGRQVSPPLTQNIPSRTRAEVWQQAKGKCEFIDPKSGRRCNGDHKLEIDHARPRALGGTHARENLRLYCRAHNVMAAWEATLMP